MKLDPIRRLLLAEDLVRRRRSSEPRRYVGAQRCARIDPNPHQIDAVMFALGRVREGGCILADEVGLGKTIEAGLVIAQLRAEGIRRVLLIAPKPLVGQWRRELHDLLAIDAVEGHAGPGGFDGDGVFLICREFVGTDAGMKALAEAEFGPKHVHRRAGACLARSHGPRVRRSRASSPTIEQLG